MSSLYISPQDLSGNSCKQKKKAPETFAKRFRAALDIRDVNQSELYNSTGIPQCIIMGYLNGDFEPKPGRLEKIAKALDVNEPWLMGWDVPLTKYDGTPEEFPTAKDSLDEIKRSKAIDILYNQMESLSEAYKNGPSDLTDLINLSVATAEIAKAISYLEK